MYRVDWDASDGRAAARRARRGPTRPDRAAPPDAGATALRPDARPQRRPHGRSASAAVRRARPRAARLSRTELAEYLEPTTSYVSIVELGMYEMTAKIHAALGASSSREATSSNRRSTARWRGSGARQNRLFIGCRQRALRVLLSDEQAARRSAQLVQRRRSSAARR